jgi:hypothetical protein
MRNTLLLVAILLMAATGASAQTVWNSTGTLTPVVTVPGQEGQGHGIAVDGAGKIWYQSYYATENVTHPTLGTVLTRALYVLNPDGSAASFSPLLYVDLPGGARDTLGGYTGLNSTGATAWLAMTGRGLRVDDDGNIIVAQGNYIYRIDHTTGLGLNKVVPNASSNAAPAVATETGAVFVANVVPGAPIFLFDKDFTPAGNAIDQTYGFSRSFEVSPDGNSIYWAGYTNHGVILYHRADEFSAFDSVGVVIPGVDTESLTFQPGTGYLWVSAGSLLDLPNRTPDVTTTWENHTWYAFDPAELAVNTVPTAKASLKWVFSATCLADPTDANCGRPRGLGFSPDGATAYVTSFGVGTATPIQVFTAGPVAIETLDADVPTAFTLEQNYPNPFNPQTSIRFTVNQSGRARLSVYDLMGRQIASLLDRDMVPGTYQVSFDGATQPSGTYLYRMDLNGQTLTGKMTLLK